MRRNIPMPLISQKSKQPNSITLIPLSRDQKLLLGRNRSSSQKKRTKLIKSKSYCETDYNNSINSAENLYARNMQLKNEINKMRKELALVKSDNIKKENEIVKKENLINSALDIKNEEYDIEKIDNIDDCKHSNLISKIKKQYNALKKELDLKNKEIFELKRNIKNSKVNELVIENTTLLSEIKKIKALYEHIQTENENYMIRLKNYNQIQSNVSKQHFIILSLQENLNAITKENDFLKEENAKLQGIISKKNAMNKIKKVFNNNNDKDKLIEDLQNQIKILKNEKKDLEQQNQFLSNQLSTMNNISNNSSNNNSSTDLNSRHLTEISYILIKNFESNKITKQIAMQNIFREIVDSLGEDSKIEKQNLIDMITDKIMSIIKTKNKKDKTKIIFFISNLLSTSGNELGNFIDNFMHVIDNVKIYDENTERNLMLKLKKDLVKENQYLKDNYKNDFISFASFRNLLNQKQIVLDDTSAEFLIYKMKQFNNEEKSMFDLSYKNLIEIIDEKEIEEKSDEVEMTRSQYDNTLNAIISRIKEKIKEKKIESINDIVNKKENVTMMEISKGLEVVLEIELNDIEMYVMYNKYKQDEDDFVDIEKLNQEIFKDEKVKEEVESVKEEKKAEIEEEIPKENIEEKEDIKEDIDKNNE